MATGGMGVQAWIAATVVAIGGLLLAYMVVVEGEPGLLPLVLIVAGGAWFFLVRHRARNRR